MDLYRKSSQIGGFSSLFAISQAECAEWKTTQDIRNRFNSADFLSNNRVVFNIGGNNFRLVVIVYYSAGILKIDRIGTHAEYDKWDLNK